MNKKQQCFLYNIMISTDFCKNKCEHLIHTFVALLLVFYTLLILASHLCSSVAFKAASQERISLNRERCENDNNPFENR